MAAPLDAVKLPDAESMQLQIDHRVYSSTSAPGGIAVEDHPKDKERPSFIRMDPPKHNDQRRVPWRMILLASLGGALELYDFVVFGVFASAIGAAFFPMANPLVSQMLAYTGFAIGYFARPVGGIVLGHFGDRIGRRIVFVGSMLVVSLLTLAMGLLPTYAQWGAAAPLLLLALRRWGPAADCQPLAASLCRPWP